MTNRVIINEDMQFSSWNEYDQRWDICVPITDKDNILIGIIYSQRCIGWPDPLDVEVCLLEGQDSEGYGDEVEWLTEAELLSAWRTVLRTYERDF